MKGKKLPVIEKEEWDNGGGGGDGLRHGDNGGGRGKREK